MDYSEMDKRIGQRIQTAREDAGLNQGQLVQRLDEAGLQWSQGTLSKVESGQRPVRLAEVTRIAGALGVDSEVFLMDEDELIWQHYLSRASEKANDVELAISEYGDALAQLAFTTDELAKKEPLDPARGARVKELMEWTPADMFWGHRVNLLRDREHMDQRVKNAGGNPNQMVTKSLGGEYTALWDEAYVATPEEAAEYEAELRAQGIEVDDA